MRPRYKVRYRPSGSNYETCKYFYDLTTAKQFRLESGGILYVVHRYKSDDKIHYQWRVI